MSAGTQRPRVSSFQEEVLYWAHRHFRRVGDNPRISFAGDPPTSVVYKDPTSNIRIEVDAVRLAATGPAPFSPWIAEWADVSSFEVAPPSKARCDTLIVTLERGGRVSVPVPHRHGPSGQFADALSLLGFLDHCLAQYKRSRLRQ